MIQEHELSEFVQDVIDEKNENELWEFFLAKVNEEKTFSEFKDSVLKDATQEIEPQSMSAPMNAEDIIKQTMEITAMTNKGVKS